MIIITKKDFEQMIENIKSHQKEIEIMNDSLSKIVNEPVYSDLGGKLLDNYIDLIALIFGDKDELLVWFIYENEFRKKHQKAHVQGKEIKINNSKELFWYLVTQSN